MAEDSANRLARHQRVGKYEVLEFIASGGMGSVYRARDVDLDRVVALKVLTPGLAGQSSVLDRFRREARMAARLRHENIVSIYEFGESQGTYFLALEFVPGADLSDYIVKKGKLRPDRARHIVLQAARALAHAHENGVVHRDIKPSNILLMKHDGRLLAKVSDLGLAIELHNEDDFRLTREGTTVGTVDYMAPEQARDSNRADIRSDIYSLGCTFYHMLTGDAPYPKGNMTERLLQHLEGQARDPREANPEVPEELVLILRRMMAKKPDDRYQTPAELIKDLERPERVLRKHGRAAQTMIPVARPAKAPPARPGLPPLDAEDDDDIPQEEEPRRDDSHDALETRYGKRGGSTDVMEAARGPRRGSSFDELDQRQERSGVARRPGSGPGKKKGVPPGVWLVGGGAGLVLLVVLIVAMSSGGGGRPSKKKVDDDGPGQAPPVALVPPEVVEPRPEVKKGPEKKDDKKSATAFEPVPGPDAEAVRREVLGPPGDFPPADRAKVIKLSRGSKPGPAAARTLADALAKAADGETTVIEVHDQGPLFVSSLPALKGRSVVLRAAQGYRPLLAWELPRQALKDEGAEPLLSLERGRLVLEGLDVVSRWEGAQATKPACLFHLRRGDFYARDCTFTVAGRHPHGVILARLQGEAADNPASLSSEAVTARLHLSRCYARGSALTLVAVEGAPAELLLEGSLAVGGRHPLFALRGRPEDPITLRGVRSTLAAGRNLVAWQNLAGKEGSPNLRGLFLDSILTRNDPESAEADLVHLAGGAAHDRLRWKGFHTVYAGWRRLLQSEGRTIAGTDLRGWRELLGGRETDRAVDETWPRNTPGQLEDLPATAFQPDGPLATAAAGAGPLGADIALLPAEPAGWAQRTFDRRPLASAPVDTPDVPEIDEGTEGFYHGERLELTGKVDLGQFLTARLKTQQPAARVVLHLSGRGEQMTSPIRVQGVQQLVLYFEPPRDPKAEPLTLTVNPKVVGDRQAFVEVERGSLELTGARIRFENTRFAVVPPYMIKVQGGDLLLSRCLLQGPLDRAPDHFRALISFAGAGPGQRTAAGLHVRDSALLSGKSLVHLQDAGTQLRARNTVGFALADAVQLDLGPQAAAKPNVTCLLDNNTWALRQGFLNVRATGDPALAGEPVTVQAVANHFAAPFDEANAAPLVRTPEPAIGRGTFVWQGKGNAFDRRLGAYLGAPGTAEKQSLKDWLAVWGRAGEQDASLVEPSAKTALVPADGSHLDRLALPREFRPEPGNPTPGADLARLGVGKKKSP